MSSGRLLSVGAEGDGDMNVWLQGMCLHVRTKIVDSRALK